MRPLILLFCLGLLYSCGNKPDRPDTGNIHVALKTLRYEQGLFSLDTNQFAPGLGKLSASYPGFQEDFLYRILNADPGWTEEVSGDYVKAFVQAYRPVYDSAEMIFSDFSGYEAEIREALKLCKYYFPEYKTPSKIITYIGPIDGYGDILADDALLVGLHHHLGKNYSAYLSSWIGQTYPKYITDRFEPSTISVNCVHNLINDLFPEEKGKGDDWQGAGQSLINIMIEKGKRLYLAGRMLPDKKEHLLIGYSEAQMKDCYLHERVIWDLFTKNNLLQTTDMNIIKNYIGESPKTQELGETAPGNIGSFAGWQIIKKFMSENEKTSLKDLMKTDPEIIFKEAKYKP